MRKIILLFAAFIIMSMNAIAQETFCIAKDGKAATIVVDEQDWKGVIRAANDLGDDVRKVTGKPATLLVNSEQRIVNSEDDGCIVVGTIGKSRLIDRLIKQKKLDVSKVKGQWESFVIDVMDGNLVVAGSDKRGTIYGIYEISQRIGVSPWYWWADVPVQHQDELYWTAGRFVQPSPKVKYRGIFINDEWPSFGDWATEHFGGINSKAYAHMFELLLRLKANYLWPAMWGSRFNEDDPESPRLADEYGIVMGTSHHEPMMRAHREYVTRKDEIGPWDYSVNKERLDKFFLDGMQRNKAYDNLVTIGMRGDGDVAMGKGDDADNMKTLAEVIKGQRSIIKKVYGREDGVPQLWAIFTEVQRYYDAGFTVPDDVTLLLCDNNWGYIRRIGRDFERKRKGGLGLYYHIDMNGGPWNDRWVNTTTIPKLREQLNLAYQTGIDRIWIINVGDLKPKEVPIDFIMHYAWNPDAVKAGDEQAWLEGFAANAFGAEHAKEAADLMAKYTKYNLWRKAEAQVPGIFNKEEMAYTDSLWLSLSARAEALRVKIPAEAQDAYYQLVYYPVVASAGVAQIYNAATRGNSNLIDQLMARDQQLSDYYHQIAGGKWSKMMQDKHIGYTQWSMPKDNMNPMKLGKPSVREGFKEKDPMPHRGALDFNVGYALQDQPATQEYSIPAYQFSRKTDGKGAAWTFLPDLGRGKGCMGSSNVLAQNSGATLEYDIEVSKSSTLNSKPSIAIGILPTQDIYPARGLRIGIQVDDLPMQTIDARRGIVDTFSEYNPQNLARSKVLKPLPPRSRLALSGFWNGRQLPRRDEVFDNLRWLDATFEGITPGKHTLKVIMIDPEIVVEQIVVNPDNNHYSYFGTQAQ
ncbi:MAG: glycosyl hydrolase 115 family protein [Bacteroidaceae bacterium]|nr:glycosyl hydrolase 115 family protein [Bacteroidaceae bacterium]